VLEEPKLRQQSAKKPRVHVDCSGFFFYCWSIVIMRFPQQSHHRDCVERMRRERGQLRVWTATVLTPFQENSRRLKLQLNTSSLAVPRACLSPADARLLVCSPRTKPGDWRSTSPSSQSHLEADDIKLSLAIGAAGSPCVAAVNRRSPGCRKRRTHRFGKGTNLICSFFDPNLIFPCWKHQDRVS